ncbi:viral protein 1 [Bovine rotavirus C]|uniref:RNA-directed RNA polymerase n=1 Tax=Bovine rotavirus C TaxID=31588 RepID=A0A060NH63_9REOV|nr:viral protein 1 [Bovine rotavirus C]
MAQSTVVDGDYDTLASDYLRFVYDFDDVTYQNNYFVTDEFKANLDAYLRSIHDGEKISQSKIDSAEKILLSKVPDKDRCLISKLVFAYGKHGNVESKLLRYGTKDALTHAAQKDVKPYENNIITSEIFKDESEYTDTYMDPAINTSCQSNCQAIMFTISRMKLYDIKNASRLEKLFSIVAATINKYGMPRHNVRYRYEWQTMRNKPYHLAAWINSSIEMIACVVDHHTYMIAKELIVKSFTNRTSLAKLVSSPMTVLTAMLPIRGTFITTENLELEYSNKTINYLISEEMSEDFMQAIEQLRNEGLKYIPDYYEKWFRSPDPLIFPNIALIYSFSFHVGYRKQALSDAVYDQITVTYDDNVNMEMYKEYSERIENEIFSILKDKVIHEDKRLEEYELSALLSMSSASNGVLKEIDFGGQKVRSTKKNMHVIDDMYNGRYTTDIPPVDERSPIPLGRRDVPGRRTRAIFILPYQYFIAQHSFAEIMLQHAKHEREYSEFYSQSNQVLSYGDVTRYLDSNSILCFTDVSQWDASQHNTRVLRKSIVRAMDRLKQLTHNENIHKAIDTYTKSQKNLENSYVLIDKKAIQYGATASGEKQTKIMNSIANKALIQTVLGKLMMDYTFDVKMIRVDGDDNYAIVRFPTAITEKLLSEFTSKLRSYYSEMNVKVKALASLTGCEIAKRYIAGGMLFFRAGVNILNHEKRNQDSSYDMAATLYANYIVNALRGLTMSRIFILTKICQMTSIKITGTLRLFPMKSILALNSTFKVFDEVDYVINYPISNLFIQLQRKLSSIKAKSKIADNIAKSPQFKSYVEFLNKSITADENPIVSNGIRLTEKAKLNSYAPIALEKRRDQFTMMVSFLQNPTTFKSEDVITINDILYFISKFIKIDSSMTLPVEENNTMPLLPSAIKRTLHYFGLRTHNYDIKGTSSAMSKLIRQYSVYTPGIEELYEIVNKSANEIRSYFASFNVPKADVDTYIGAQIYKHDRFKILQAYIYNLLSVNYGMYQLVDLNSAKFFNHVIHTPMAKTPTAVFMIDLALRLKVINHCVEKNEIITISVHASKTDYLKLWRMLWKVKTMNSPYSKNSIFDE